MNFRILKKLIGNILIVMFPILFWSSISFAYLNETADSQKAVTQTAEKMGPEAVNHLKELKAHIQETSYDTTLKLCEGYRRVLNKGPMRIPHSLSQEQLDALPDSPYKRHLTGQWVYSMTDAFKPWGRIFYEGLSVFASSVGQIEFDVLGQPIKLGGKGLKRSYIDTEVDQPHKSIQVQGKEKWMSILKTAAHHFWQSADTLYFINSSGFARGALHCLELPNDRHLSRAVNKFAIAIIAMDMGGSLAFNTAFSYLIGLTVKAALATVVGRVIAWPFKVIISILKKKITLASIGVWVALDFAKDLETYFTHRQENIDYIAHLQKAINNPGEFLKESDPTIFFNNYFNTSLQYSMALDQERAKRSGEVICPRVLAHANQVSGSMEHGLYTEELRNECFEIYQDFLFSIANHWLESSNQYYVDILNGEQEVDPAFKKEVDGTYPIFKYFYPFNL